jgi:hypothetical protein
VRHGVSTTRPFPLHESHTRDVWITPNGVRWLILTWPVPPHAGQTFGEVPFAAPEPLQSLQVLTFW